MSTNPEGSNIPNIIANAEEGKNKLRETLSSGMLEKHLLTLDLAGLGFSLIGDTLVADAIEKATKEIRAAQAAQEALNKI